MKSVVRIANASGYWGDDPEALLRQVTGGPIDYVTMDFLAEITMVILQRQRARDPKAGFAYDFVEQLKLRPAGDRRARHHGDRQRRRHQPVRLRRGGRGAVPRGRRVAADRRGRAATTCCRGSTRWQRRGACARPHGRRAPLRRDPRPRRRRQRLPQRPPGGRGAARRRAHRRHRPHHRRGADPGPAGARVRLGAGTTGTASRPASPPATSSSAARRRPAATSPTGSASRRCSTSATRSPRRRPDGSFVVTKHPGTGGMRHAAHGHRAAALRDRRSARLPDARRHAPTSPPCS